MVCPNCGAYCDPNLIYCDNCGSDLSESPVTDLRPTPRYPRFAEVPSQYKPLSSWAYFGYSLLYTIPLVGFILLIVFSLDDSNINRRNHARSYWCALLIGVIISVITLVVLLLLGFSLRHLIYTLF